MGSNVTCPVCSQKVSESAINQHLDSGCSDVGTSTSSDAPMVGHSLSSSKSASASGSKASRKALHVDAPLAPIFGKAGPSSSPNAPSTPSTRLSSSKRTAEFLKSSKLINDGDPLPSNPSKRARTTASNLESAQPLAERLRPQSLDDFVGQPHLTGSDSLLRNLIDSGGNMGSIIFWGPPGCGKTTLARLLAKASGAVFKELSATGVGINEVRQVFEEAKGLLSLTGRKTILFLDEVHRFNKAQQVWTLCSMLNISDYMNKDIFLPYVEQGHIQLIGATTENPSFRVNGALLSRCRVFVLERLKDDDIKEIITRAIARISSANKKPPSTGTLVLPNIQPSSTPLPAEPSSPLLDSSQASSSTIAGTTPTALPFPDYPQIAPQVLSSLVSLSSGDARTALSLLSLVLAAPATTPTRQLLESLRTSVIGGYDRTGDTHYDLISALHKSVRGSAGSAALYWLARMLRGGEDPLFIARRMLVCASEDIGLADPKALPLAMATYQACQVIGMPECRIHLAHLVSYLSEAPKSTRSYKAYQRAEEAAARDMTLPVPLQIRNAPTKLMSDLGYAEGYRYNADYIHPVHNEYLPSQLKDNIYLLKEGDLSDRTWDEDALKAWETEENGGQEWEGRRKECQSNMVQGEPSTKLHTK